VNALPDETVEIRDSRVLIDGKVLSEPYLPDQKPIPDFRADSSSRRLCICIGRQPGGELRQPGNGTDSDLIHHGKASWRISETVNGGNQNGKPFDTAVRLSPLALYLDTSQGDRP